MNIFWESSVLGEKALCLERKLREEAQCSKRKINVWRGNSVLEELSAWRESSMLGEEAQCSERKLSARRAQCSVLGKDMWSCLVYLWGQVLSQNGLFAVR